MNLAVISAALVALVLIGAPAQAADREVMGEELETLLSGNSIDGGGVKGTMSSTFRRTDARSMSLMEDRPTGAHGASAAQAVTARSGVAAARAVTRWTSATARYTG